MNSLTRRDSSYLYSLSKPSSLVSEQFRIIRATLLRVTKEKGVKTILVTSALPGEGKTFVSSNLAANIAREVSEKVVLVDGDMRNSSINRVFNLVDNQQGLSSFLMEDIRLNGLLCNTDIPNLSILPFGRNYQSQLMDLLAQKMANLTKSIQMLYGNCYIIFDSGPVQLLADTLVMSEMVDGIVLVVKMGHTKRNLVKKTVDVLGRDKILGVILNYCDLPYKVYQHYYRYYRGKTGLNINSSSPHKE